jgi:nitrate reductase (cytochrome), electron transfer subunit
MTHKKTHFRAGAIVVAAIALVLAVLLIPPSPANAAGSTASSGPVKLKSLRDRDISTPAEMDSENYRIERERGVLPRDFVQQPPLIPHSIKGYNITRNFNKCLDCHAWSRTQETGATKVSVTHFRDREGKELSSISPLRYFCVQCHIAQTDAKPLVANTFKKVDGLK